MNISGSKFEFSARILPPPAMPRYKNLSGSSGVRSYEIGDDYIVVRFVNGDAYHYSYKRPGKLFVERMKKLAAAGKGLSTYISQRVRERYEKKM